MRTKLTLYAVTVFISSLKYKLIIIFLILNSAFSFSQTCSANLDVSKGRKTRSTSSSGTYYKMTITNNGISNDTYTLSSQNTNGSCSNSDNSSTTSNVILNISFTDINLNSISTISVNSGETLTFFVHVTVPVGTPINKWCCTQITASSSICENYYANSSLHTLVINSNDN